VEGGRRGKVVVGKVVVNHTARVAGQWASIYQHALQDIFTTTSVEVWRAVAISHLGL
jgi:hypothetical protein